MKILLLGDTISSMNFQKVNDGYVVVLSHGEEIISSLSQFCAEQAIVSGKIQAIGAVDSVELGFYDLPAKEYQWNKFEQGMEIVSLLGNIALVEEKPFIHGHIVVSDSQFQCFGGHLKEGIVGATCEVHITQFDASIERVMNNEIGLKLLRCDNSQASESSN